MSQKESIQQISVNDLQPSRTNPRKFFDQGELTSLSASIAESGVQQPIIARLLEPGRFEIVAGERRWRASKMAGKIAIPAIVRELDDAAAEQLQLIENLQRADLAPMEEAEGFGKLQAKGLAIAAIADGIGKPHRFVAERLQLLQLPKSGQEALADGRLLLAVAFLIARMPIAALREQAVKLLASRKGDDEPMGLKRAREEIEDKFMLQLAKAPFDIKDAQLVPAAGACAGCPKRTGNQKELFADIKGADICLDPICFRAKAAAAREARLAKAKAEGQKIIAGAAAKQAMPWEHGELREYVELDREMWVSGSRKKVRSFFKELPPTALFVNPYSQEVSEVISRKEIAPFLKERSRSSGSAQASAERKREKLEAAQRIAVYRAMIERFGKTAFTSIKIEEMRAIASAFFGELGFEKRKAVAVQWAPPFDRKKQKSFEYVNGAIDKLEGKIQQMTPAELGRVLIECTISDDLCKFGDGGALDWFAKRAGVNAKKVRDGVRQALAEKPKKKPAKKGAK